MSKYLRLDMYVNSREFLIGEGDVSERGYEEILNLSDVITSAIAATLRETGAGRVETNNLSEKEIDILWEVTGLEITGSDEINFCMCLWDGDEHLQSLVSLKEIK